MKPKVLVYKPELLPYSETFIKEQILAYQKWQGVLVGHHRVPQGLSLEDLDIRLLLNDPPGHIEDVLWRFRRWLGLTQRRELNLLAQENAQLLHAHFGTVAVDIWPTAKALNLPMVVTLHGYDINIYREWWEQGHGGYRRRTYPQKLLALAREPNVQFIAVSSAIRQRAIEYGIPEDKIRVCHIGVDTNRFKPGPPPLSQRTQRVLFIGRLIEKKGAKYLIEAFKKTSEKIPNAELIIVGDGPERTSLEQIAAEISPNIKFLGALDTHRIQEQLSQARVFCLPSITASNGDAEGLPIVILEAQACGLMVITSAFGAIGDAVTDQETGFIFQEGDTTRLSEILTMTLSDDSLAEEYSSKSRAHAVANFDISSNTENLEMIYNEIAQL